MSQTVNAKMENDFRNPLGLLSDCHRRIEKFLEQIIRICVIARTLNDEQREVLDTALRYFRQAAPLHTTDEEVSLFPRLRQRATAGDETARRALQVMERLEADHDAADERHAIIDELGMRWLQEDALDESDARRLAAEARELRAFYAAHIAVEDNELFPLAKQILSSENLEDVGREMATRRGLDFDNLPAVGRCAAQSGARRSVKE